MGDWKFGDVLEDKVANPAGSNALVMVINITTATKHPSAAYESYVVIGLIDQGRSGYHTGSITDAHDYNWTRIDE